LLPLRRGKKDFLLWRDLRGDVHCPCTARLTVQLPSYSRTSRCTGGSDSTFSSRLQRPCLRLAGPGPPVIGGKRWALGAIDSSGSPGRRGVQRGNNLFKGMRRRDCVAEPLELFRFKCARHCLSRCQKLSAPQTEQLIGLSGHHPIQPRLHRIDVGLPRTKTSPVSQQLATFTPHDNYILLHRDFILS
jgi:hypothetical protein